MARGKGGPTPQPQPNDRGGKRATDRRVRHDKSEVVVGTISTDGLDVDRLNRLRGMGIKVRQATVGESVREAAARVQASVPFRSEIVDRDAFGAIVHLLVAYYHDTGRVDPLRALRRSNVDAYLMSRNRPARRTLRYLLYTAGRVWYPHEYPPAFTLDAPRQIRTAPATDEEIDALYRVALTLGEKWEPALTVLVDLMYGVGARPEELKHLRREHIRVERHHGERWVVVTLQTPKTAPRDVPVLDEQIGRELEYYAANARHDLLLAFGSAPTVERNGINRVNDRLAERGQPERLNAQALRHAWIQEIVQLVPVSEFCYLAGVTSLHHMSDLDVVADATGDINEITAHFLEDGQ
ncbi:hypothetical protein K8O93_17450 [Gordonia bronchialis]|uniref:tyrosine-type recombinase/integrase n=1 Tax=Gordonia bronchialis TaxID=2054 RepID=UPI001CBEB141|nr:site-specific integrase [Gordonia bronchialis]UAK36970.1 hypothetical protein K8O93_17450 [Gordonia bronchialis]